MSFGGMNESTGNVHRGQLITITFNTLNHVSLSLISEEARKLYDKETVIIVNSMCFLCVSKRQNCTTIYLEQIGNKLA